MAYRVVGKERPPAAEFEIEMRGDAQASDSVAHTRERFKRYLSDEVEQTAAITRCLLLDDDKGNLLLEFGGIIGNLFEEISALKEWCEKHNVDNGQWPVVVARWWCHILGRDPSEWPGFQDWSRDGQ